jgi:NADPH:quinone reductase
MLQIAYGLLTVGLDAQPGQSTLICGGASSVGMATAVLAKQRKMTVLSTTRSVDKSAALTDIGVDHVLIDDGDVTKQVRAILPEGVDTALELVGTPTLPDTLRATRLHGVVCFTGMLSNQWTVRDFYPIDYLPRGVRLTAYGGDAGDLPRACCRVSSTPSRPATRWYRSRMSTASMRSSRRTSLWRRGV